MIVLNFLNDLGLEIFKIPSGEITNFHILRHIGKLNKKKKSNFSTGMANIGEIEDALDILINAGTKRKYHSFTCKYRISNTYEDVNLKAMVTIGNTFDIVWI